MLTVPGEQAPPTEIDISELGPGSLQTPVVDFTWAYTPGNSHIQVAGTIINESGRPLQGILLTGVLYDQTGNPIAYGTSFVTPTYLPPGEKGTFSLTALVKREKGVTHTRLIVSTRTTSPY
jgi:hypothetical protein